MTKLGTNIHHIFFPARDYKSGISKIFRSLKCNTVELDVETHRLLHAMSEPPRKPSVENMAIVIQKHNRKECRCYK